MKITIPGYICAQMYEWDKKPTFIWTSIEPSSEHCVVVRAHDIDVEVPDDFDFNAFRLASLIKRKAEIKEREIPRIDYQIKNVLEKIMPKKEDAQ
jgi:hypothetical protein